MISAIDLLACSGSYFTREIVTLLTTFRRGSGAKLAPGGSSSSSAPSSNAPA